MDVIRMVDGNLAAGASRLEVFETGTGTGNLFVTKTGFSQSHSLEIAGLTPDQIEIIKTFAMHVALLENVDICKGK